VTQPDLDELVALARRDRPPPSVLIAIARSLRVPFVATGVVAVPKTAFGSIMAKVGLSRPALLGWGAGSALVATSVVAAVLLREPAAPQAPPPQAPLARPALHAAKTFSVAQEEGSRPEPETAEPASSVEQRVVRDAPAIWGEPELIERARKALGTEPRRALVLTREHQRRFPTGALSVERDVIALHALARTGQAAEARRRALAFEARHPKSIHLPQVRALLRRLDAP
jgi:hypothetical protein